MTERDDDRGLQALLGALRDEPAEADRAAFAARLHLRLSEAGVPVAQGAAARLAAWLRERPLVLGGISGAVAGVLSFALVSAIATGVSTTPTKGAPLARANAAVSPVLPVLPACAPAGLEASAEVFVVPAGKVALVQLHFAVDHDIEQAEFSVLLPDGLAFFSAGDALPERAFHWSAPLARGDNRVPLALIGARPGRHRFAATATIGGEVVVHEVVLDVQGPV